MLHYEIYGCEKLIIEPQLAIGALTPKPKKLNDASDIIAFGIPNVTVTINVDKQLG